MLNHAIIIQTFWIRKNAIKKSISLLKSKDVLIIAGKGHEKYQIIKGKKFPFDDVKIAKNFLKKWKKIL